MKNVDRLMFFSFEIIRERRLEFQGKINFYRIRLNDERTKKCSVSKDLAKHRYRVKKLKDRFECLTLIFNVEPSDDENIRIQAQHVIEVSRWIFQILR